MNRIKTPSAYFLFVNISIAGIIGYLFYIVDSNVDKYGSYTPLPSELLKLATGALLLLLFIALLFVLWGKHHARFSLYINTKIMSFKHPRIVCEFLLLFILNMCLIGWLLISGATRVNDFIGESIFLRMNQYYPLGILFAFLFAGFLYLGYSLGIPDLMIYPITKWHKWGNKWLIAQVVFMTFWTVYLSTSLNLRQVYTAKPAFFPELADAFLNGRLDLIEPESVKDLTYYNDKYYVSFPPLASLLMMPVVAVAGITGVNTAFWNTVTAAVGVAFIFLALDQLVVLGWSRLSRRDTLLLALFFGLGTVQYFMSIRGPVYYISQILTATMLSASIWVGLLKYKSERAMQISLHGLATGFVLAAALLARPNVVFAALALLAFQYQKHLDERVDSPYKKTLIWAIWFSLPVLLVVAGMAWYNHARFGSMFEFGYRYMNVVDPTLVMDLQKYGQFHPHFIFRNITDNFLRIPQWYQACARLAPSPRGMSIFIVSPLIVYLFRSFKKEIWVKGAWASLFAILFTHLLYFNSGALQFGYRFSLDFTPLMVLLLAVAFKDRLNKTAVALIFIGILVNFIGVLWIARAWCVNW